MRRMKAASERFPVRTVGCAQSSGNEAHFARTPPTVGTDRGSYELDGTSTSGASGWGRVPLMMVHPRLRGPE